MSNEELEVLLDCKKRYQERVNHRKNIKLVNKYKKYLDMIDSLLFYYNYNR